MLRIVSRQWSARRNLKKTNLFALTALMIFSLLLPSETMALFNANNTQKPVRRNIASLDSARNTPTAQPLHEAARPLDIQQKPDRTRLKELVSERKSHSKTFLNKDGSKTIEYHTRQQHYTEGKAEWKAINNNVTQQRTTSNKTAFNGKAGQINSSMKPLGEGIELQADGHTITIKPSGANNVQAEQKDNHTVIYRNAWKGVDLEYELRGEAVKEIIVVKDKTAPTTFDFTVTGGTVIDHPTRAGELTIEGMPDAYSFSSVTLDVNGRGVISESRVAQAATPNGIRIALDQAWVKKLPTSSFPLRIDPTFTKQGDANISYKMYKSDGYNCGPSNCYINTGSLNDNGWKSWRTYLRFDYSPLNNKTVLDAKLYGWFKGGIGGNTANRTMTLGHAQCINSFGCGYAWAGATTASTDYNITFTDKLKSLVDSDDYSAWWVLRNDEGSTATYKPYYDTKLTVTYDTPTPVATAVSPADKATTVMMQPKLQVNSVSDSDGEAVQYYFRVATNPDGETGAVINSGWTSSREWTVPANILQDGRTYYWKTYTKGYAQTNPNWVRSFKIDMRTGKNSTQAYEQVGPLAVDLATGNATTSASTHNISALAGDIGLSLNYNTPALVASGTATKTATKYGLTGYYYNDPSNNSTLPSSLTDSNRLLMVRSDNKISFNWGNGAASPGLPTDRFLVRWKGYLTVPTTGSYTVGVNADDGVRIKLGTGLLGADESVLDSWSYASGNRWASAKNLPANQPIPITVEYNEVTAGANIDLLVRGTNLSEQQMPTTWLAPNANTLPDGWELGLGDASVNFERLQIQSNTAILSDSTGQKYEYTWKGSAYKAPENQEATLLRNNNNTYTVLDNDGKTYVFDAEGRLSSVTAPEDDKQPAALKYEYAGNPSRLVKITDGVNSARNGTLHYSGDSECQVTSGFDAVPAGYLCAFKTTDGKKTTLQYKNGNLARIAQPGDEYDDYGYDNLGRIVTYRDGLANDAIAYGVRANDATVTSEITYDASGKVISVKAPAPSTGASREEQTLEYLTGATALHVTGASEPHGFSRKVTYDSTFRTTSDTNLANLTTTTEWDVVKDLVLSTTDPTGLKSTTIYNDNDLPVDTYGPAPATWFGNDRKPIASRVNDVPRLGTKYDEGVTGLGVSAYNNVKLSGAPKYHFTSANQASEPSVTLDLTNSNLTPTDGLSTRATGKIKLDQVGIYNFRLYHGGGTRLYIDNQLIIDDWGDGAERFSPTGTYTNATAGQTVDVIIEAYKSGTSGSGTNARVAAVLHQKAPGQSAFTGTGLAQQLSPAYNLQTSTTAYDSQLGNVTTTTQYSNPAYGQVSSTTLDPGGLNYQSQATYEAPGSGFLRQTNKTLPGGGTTTYQHYSAADTRDNPCTPETENYLQAGRPKGKVEADPDGAGSQTGRSSETIYNDAGDVVATRYNDDAWTCTTYDERGRVLTTTVPGRTEAGQTLPGRTITNNYLASNNPLVTSTTDSSGTITVTNDLLGRTVSYTDALGNATVNTYDTYSKLTSRTSPVGTETYEYDNYDRLTVQKLGNTTYATVSYDQYSRLASVQYPAGVALSSITRDQLGREDSSTYIVGGQTYTDTIERYTSGDVKQGTENGVTKHYAYDNAGRLTGATIGSTSYTYEFGVPDASCSSTPGYNATTGKNGNRTKLTVNGQTTTYCYDSADRLISSSDASLTDVQYDTHGNTTSLGNSSHKTEFGYDASDRNTRIAAENTETLYTRDAQGRVISREHKENGVTTGGVSYGFTGSGDSPDFLTDSAGTVNQRYLTLPGDVVVTLRADQTGADATTYSLPNLHGDVSLTVNGDGVVETTYMTGPFGEELEGPSMPNNTAAGTSWNYVGQHQKLTDTDTSTIFGGIIQMGARVYVPALGRFLQTDPIEGAGDNTYSYVNDPVNEEDLDGEIAPLVAFVAWQLGRVAVQQSVKFAAKQAAKQAVKQVAKKSMTASAKKVVQKGAVKKTIISSHARSQMATRGVSRAMVKQTISKGSRYIDRKHTGVDAYVLRNPITRKYTYVAKNRLTGRVTTVIVRTKFNPTTGRWIRY